MTFTEFKERYDYEGSVVLLEGKRNVREADRNKLHELGRLLASTTEKMIFRSGNAPGSDELFAGGVASVAPDRMQVIVPYTGHRKKQNRDFDTVSLDDVNLSEEPEVVYQSKANKKTEKHIDRYVAGDHNKFTVKAAYIIRDTVKVLGTEEVPPATFGIFYDDLQKPKSGGTGHTINVCRQNDIPAIDQSVWFEWL